MAHKSKTPKSAIRDSQPGFADYFHRSQQPLQALFFLLPLIVAYELGVLIYATRYADLITGTGVIHTSQTLHIKARLWLLGFFEWFGVGGYYLPGFIMVAALLGGHILRKDRWSLEPALYGWMGIESLLAALPLFVFGLTFSPAPGIPGGRLEDLGLGGLASLQASSLKPFLASLAGNGLSGGGGFTGLSWQAEIVFSLGAGIYEELLFRLILIAALHALLVDWLKIPDLWGSTAAMVLSAVAFALYHFSQDNSFTFSLFGYYTIAGAYLACLYVGRGIGIAAGAHAFYDLLVVAWHLFR